MRVADIESIILQHDMDEELGFAQGYYNKRTAHLLKVHTDEGISEFMRIPSMAHAFGAPVIPHVWGSDVLVAVDMHLVSVIPDLPDGLQQFDPMLEYDATANLFHEHLLTQPLDIRAQVKEHGGRVGPPQHPGIGIELNEDFVQRYRVA